MRVSRTRFSKRRIKRKTEFPIVAVVEKKRKVDSIKSLSFGIVKNQAATKQQKKSPTASSPEGIKDLIGTNGLEKQNKDRVFTDGTAQPLTEGTPYSETEQKDSRFTQKNIAFKPVKKSRATIDYKNVVLLRNLITAEGKILPRRINKLTSKQQRNVQKAIKSARIMGLIPFINKSRPF